MKKKTFAQVAKSIESKYYKNRKPGEDKLTDEAYNRDMSELMSKQELAKAEKGVDNNQNFAYGGKLKKMGDGGTFERDPRTQFEADMIIPQDPLSDLNIDDSYMDNIGDKDIDKGILDPNAKRGPVRLGATGNDLLGLGLNTASNAFATYQKNKFQKEQNRLNKEAKSNLLKDIDVNLGRVSAQEVDLSREREKIEGDAALSESAGRHAARGARSASQANRIKASTRLGSQRAAGDLLGKSYQREEGLNAAERAKAEQFNANLESREADINSRRRMQVEQMYPQGADPTGMNLGQFAQATTGGIQNVLKSGIKRNELSGLLDDLVSNYRVTKDPETLKRITELKNLDKQ